MIGINMIDYNNNNSNHSDITSGNYNINIIIIIIVIINIIIINSLQCGSFSILSDADKVSRRISDILLNRTCSHARFAEDSGNIIDGKNDNINNNNNNKNNSNTRLT